MVCEAGQKARKSAFRFLSHHPYKTRTSHPWWRGDLKSYKKYYLFGACFYTQRERHCSLARIVSITHTVSLSGARNSLAIFVFILSRAIEEVEYIG